MAARKKNFKDLFVYNVDQYIMQKGTGKFRAKYISWPDAWALLKIEVPDATFHTYECPTSGMPYFVSPDGCGVMVKVGVTVNGIEMICWQPITDNAMKGKKVSQIASSDIANTEKRALVKAIGMHGLGLQLWSKLEKILFNVREQEARDLEQMATQEAADLDKICTKPPKTLKTHHPSFNEKERKTFFAKLKEVGIPYEDLKKWREKTGKPVPSQMEQKNRDIMLEWLKNPDNKQKIYEEAS
tara:strand:+ start:1832 stop:2557 length:726 start_codon:yes stop_codon:yes gene_type:complete